MVFELVDYSDDPVIDVRRKTSEIDRVMCQGQVLLFSNRSFLQKTQSSKSIEKHQKLTGSSVKVRLVLRFRKADYLIPSMGTASTNLAPFSTRHIPSRLTSHLSIYVPNFATLRQIETFLFFLLSNSESYGSIDGPDDYVSDNEGVASRYDIDQ